MNKKNLNKVIAGVLLISLLALTGCATGSGNSISRAISRSLDHQAYTIGTQIGNGTFY